MAATTINPTPFIPGSRTIDGGALDSAIAAPQFSSTDGITALASGGQTGATLLFSTINRVVTVANANDSVALPLSTGTQVILVVNGHASNSMQVFGSGTDTINGVATGTGVAQAAGVSAIYFSTTPAPAGKWFRVLSA